MPETPEQLYERSKGDCAVIGSFAAIWDDILPPVPEDVWRANMDVVARAMSVEL